MARPEWGAFPAGFALGVRVGLVIFVMAINRKYGGIWTALAGLILFTGCTSSSPIADSPVVEAPADQGPSLEEIDWQIDWDRVGPVQVGSTLEEIAAALGPGFEIADAGTLGEGLGGYSVSLDGEVLLYFGSYDSEGEMFDLLLVDNPRLGLASGLRPGTTLAEAADLHGEPRLWFHSVSHGRESVSFPDNTGDSSETIQIETQGVESLQAGIYGDPEPEDEDLFVTTEYDPAGTIKSISVTCFGPGRQSCPP